MSIAWFRHNKEERWHRGTAYGECGVRMDPRYAMSALQPALPPEETCYDCMAARPRQNIERITAEINELLLERVEYENELARLDPFRPLQPRA